jgi:hypothetical protein
VVDLAHVSHHPYEDETGRRTSDAVANFPAIPFTHKAVEREQSFDEGWIKRSDKEFADLAHQPFALSELKRGWPKDGKTVFSTTKAVFFGLSSDATLGATLRDRSPDRKAATLQLVRATGSTVLVLASICCVGLWCSAIFRRSIHSTAACYGIVLVLSVITAVVFGILMSHWTSHNLLLRAEGPPAYVQAPLFLNPLYPLLSTMDDATFREFIYPTSSCMLFSAMGCLAAAFAMRRLKRGGDQL